MGEWILYKEVQVLDGYGEPWDFIPFIFVGSISNTAKINKAPLYSICKINIGHFINSAENEDIIF